MPRGLAAPGRPVFSSSTEPVAEPAVGAEHGVACATRTLAENDVTVTAVAVARKGAGLRGGPVRIQPAPSALLGLKQGVRMVRDVRPVGCGGRPIAEALRNAAAESFHLGQPRPSARAIWNWQLQFAKPHSHS